MNWPKVNKDLPARAQWAVERSVCNPIYFYCIWHNLFIFLLKKCSIPLFSFKLKSLLVFLGENTMKAVDSRHSSGRFGLPSFPCHLSQAINLLPAVGSLSEENSKGAWRLSRIVTVKCSCCTVTEFSYTLKW